LIRETGARPLAHSILDMAERLAQLRGVQLREEVAVCAKALEEHYIQARCPDARVGSYEEWEARRCLECLEELWQWISG